MAGADDAADAVEVGFGHGSPGGEAQAAVEQVLGDFSANRPRLVTFLSRPALLVVNRKQGILESFGPMVL